MTSLRRIYDYSLNEILRKNKTFRELKEEIGLDAIFANTVVKDDQATQNAIYYYFELERLCSHDDDRFLFYLRRNLLEWYPIYKDQLDMWEERKSLEWFYNKEYTEETEHKGENKIDETARKELIRELRRLIQDISQENMNGSGKGSSESTDEATGRRLGQTRASEATEQTETSSGKQRDFSFTYPESNYTGGVIPYDLEKNPTVEFINNQQDQLTSSTSTTKGRTDRAQEDAEGTEDNAHNQASNEYSQQQITESKAQSEQGEQGVEETGEQTNRNEQETWKETGKHTGENLNSLAAELIEQLPMTDFFAQFVKHLSICFMNTEILDEEYF